MSGQDILPYQTFIIGALLSVFLTNSAKQALSVSNQNAISHFAGGTTLILAISCAHTLPNFTLLGALACQMLALIWINSYIQIKSLKIYVYSLLTAITLPVIMITLWETIGYLRISIRDIIGIISVTIPIFIAPFLLNTQQYSRLRNHLEVISLFLVTITAEHCSLQLSKLLTYVKLKQYYLPLTYAVLRSMPPISFLLHLSY